MTPKKILLTGVSGQVGHALLPNIHSQYQVVALSRDALDLSNCDEIRRVVQEVKPDLIINPAAYTSVSKAESESDLAHAINAIAPRVFAEEASKLNAALIHFSTDYVFDGNKNTPYVETDAVNPVNVYGVTKLAGEEAIRSVGLPHMILRTSWVYGAYGKNFLKTILRLAKERDKLSIIADQFGAPTSSQSIAAAMFELLGMWQCEQEKETGIYHFTNTGSTSWHGFASEIVSEYSRLNGKPELSVEAADISKIATAEYPIVALRPVNSRLDNRKLKQTFGVQLRDWQDGLHTEMKSLLTSS